MTRRRTITLLGLALALPLGLGGCAAHPQAAALTDVGDLPTPASAWPSAQYDARHSSDTRAVGPQKGTVRWSTKLDGNLTPGPVIEADGSVLVGSNSGSLTALDPSDGSVRWRFDGGAGFGADLSTSPSVLADGTILWPGPSNTLFALTASGKKLWTLRMKGQVLSPAVAGHDRVYVADTTGHFVALHVDGAHGATHSVAWTKDLGGPDYASPSVGPDGTIYTASSKHLVALTDRGSSGTERWRFTAKRVIEVSNGVSPDGIVVVGTNGDKEYGVKPDGKAAWAIDLGDWTYSSSSVRSSGLASFADNSGRIRTVDTATGAVKRTISPAAPGKEHAWTSIVVDSRGDQYWASMTGHVYGYAADGSNLFTLPVDSGVDGYPALGSDGTLYVGSTGGTLYAIGT